MGFASVTHFTRRFRERFETTPCGLCAKRRRMNHLGKCASLARDAAVLKLVGHAADCRMAHKTVSGRDDPEVILVSSADAGEFLAGSLFSIKSVMPVPFFSMQAPLHSMRAAFITISSVVCG
ncbi:MAG TPA: hypothetical protein VKO85_08020 [Wenzhouxiangellaceae bacterium]|nr:hypothetical protein [Wenzhouxiangellaceae bacterium]